MKKLSAVRLTFSAALFVGAGVSDLEKLLPAGGATGVLGAGELSGERVICRLVSPSLTALKI